MSRNATLEIGAKRAHQHVPLSQLIWAIILTKRNLWDFMQQEAVLGSACEISCELEVERLLDQFFDRALYYAAVGTSVHASPNRCSMASAVV